MTLLSALPVTELLSELGCPKKLWNSDMWIIAEARTFTSSVKRAGPYTC